MRISPGTGRICLKTRLRVIIPFHLLLCTSTRSSYFSGPIILASLVSRMHLACHRVPHASRCGLSGPETKAPPLVRRRPPDQHQAMCFAQVPRAANCYVERRPRSLCVGMCVQCAPTIQTNCSKCVSTFWLQTPVASVAGACSFWPIKGGSLEYQQNGVTVVLRKESLD